MCLCVVCTDVREGYCYLMLTGGRCLTHDPRLPVTTTKAQCCCSNGAAWGQACEKCPRLGTGKSPHKLDTSSDLGAFKLNKRQLTES